MPKAMESLKRWTPEEVRALGTVTDVGTAGEILGLTRGAAYHAARTEQFPVEVLKISKRRWVVPIAPLLRVLGIDEGSEVN
ncbi:hypothetical protein [Amycolatopsis sp. lyj-23]|uniref:hypothetical protein n=1 Tax=Amycolatopsis sp. lyj-23 TaxID=2789283 RepID=UPI00397A3025